MEHDGSLPFHVRQNEYNIVITLLFITYFKTIIAYARYS
jgi:hypothetical protein